MKNILEIGVKIKNINKVFFMTKMATFIMEFLKMIKKTEKEKLNLKMEIFLKENF